MPDVPVLATRLDDSYARALPELCLAWRGDEVPAPSLLVANEPLAAELGLDASRLGEPAALNLLTGRPEHLHTVAQAYAGHQFGQFVPRLGDGRALLLGELRTPDGRLVDLHLKGSGRTPFSRGADGKAVIGPMLREYIIGEALAGLGIPTTRALAVAGTGEQVWRDGERYPGAVACRVAASHLRVGTFQYAAITGDRDLLRRLADYAIARHHPLAAEADNRYLALLAAVVEAQAELIAAWMSVGFVHGVMNTDNMTISGESIDFGPCAFVDYYHPDTVFSSIDYAGRYRFSNQPAAAEWNLARFAETLLPLIDDDPEAAVEPATDVLGQFSASYQTHWLARMAAKLGLTRPDQSLTDDLLDLLADERVDYTSFFRALAAGTAGDLFTDTQRFGVWAARRARLLAGNEADVRAAMDAVNPAHIARNHVVEEVLTRATGGDLRGVERIVAALRRPFEPDEQASDLASPPPAGSPRIITYCGT